MQRLSGVSSGDFVSMFGMRRLVTLNVTTQAHNQSLKTKAFFFEDRWVSPRQMGPAWVRASELILCQL